MTKIQQILSTFILTLNTEYHVNKRVVNLQGISIKMHNAIKINSFFF